MLARRQGVVRLRLHPFGHVPIVPGEDEAVTRVDEPHIELGLPPWLGGRLQGARSTTSQPGKRPTIKVKSLLSAERSSPFALPDPVSRERRRLHGQRHKVSRSRVQGPRPLPPCAGPCMGTRRHQGVGPAPAPGREPASRVGLPISSAVTLMAARPSPRPFQRSSQPRARRVPVPRHPRPPRRGWVEGREVIEITLIITTK